VTTSGDHNGNFKGAILPIIVLQLYILWLGNQSFHHNNRSVVSAKDTCISVV